MTWQYVFLAGESKKMYHDDNEVSFHLLNQANLFSRENVVKFKSQGDTLNFILSSLSWGLTSSGFNPAKLWGKGGGGGFQWTAPANLFVITWKSLLYQP